MGAYDSPTGIDTTPDAGPAEESVRLMREVRFSVDRDWAVAAHGAEGFEKALPVTNSWGGWPSAVGIAPYLVLRVIVSGRPDPVTGYLLSIQTLDKLLRNHAIPLTAQRLRAAGVGLTGESLVRGIWESLAGAAPLAKPDTGSGDAVAVRGKFPAENSIYPILNTTREALSRVFRPCRANQPRTWN